MLFACLFFCWFVVCCVISYGVFPVVVFVCWLSVVRSCLLVFQNKIQKQTSKQNKHPKTYTKRQGHDKNANTHTKTTTQTQTHVDCSVVVVFFGCVCFVCVVCLFVLTYCEFLFFVVVLFVYDAAVVCVVLCLMCYVCVVCVCFLSYAKKKQNRNLNTNTEQQQHAIHQNRTNQTNTKQHKTKQTIVSGRNHMGQMRVCVCVVRRVCVMCVLLVGLIISVFRGVYVAWCV